MNNFYYKNVFLANLKKRLRHRQLRLQTCKRLQTNVKTHLLTKTKLLEQRKQKGACGIASYGYKRVKNCKQI